jgi:transcriptional regulator with XRE-family HTH domain
MFGNLFKSLRDDLDLTQVELSKKLKISQGYLSKIERNDLEPALSVFIRTARLAGSASDRVEEKFFKAVWG